MSKRRSPWLCPAPSVGAGFFISSCNDGSDRSLRLPTVGAGRRLHARFRSANEEQWSNLGSLSGRRAASRKKSPTRRDGDDSMPASTMVAFRSKSQIGDHGQGNNKSESTPRPSVPGGRGADRRRGSGLSTRPVFGQDMWSELSPTSTEDGYGSDHGTRRATERAPHVYA
jgi:hypothetical protein